jgi:hypothetical protein
MERERVEVDRLASVPGAGDEDAGVAAVIAVVDGALTQRFAASGLHH